MNALIDEGLDIDALAVAWEAVDRLVQLRPLDSDADYQHAASLLRRIWNPVQQSQDHPLGSLLRLLTSMVNDYEKNHHTLDESEPYEMLQFVMEQGEWRAADIKDVVDSATLEDILAGRRKIDAEMAQRLGIFFRVSPQLFLKQE